MNQQTLKENFEYVSNNINEACNRVGRDPDEVTLIAVSKTKPIEMVEDAIAAGMSVFGENKPQEIRDKTKVITDEHIEWHMIGKLQSNKIKYVIDKTALIHSIDSLRLANTLNDEAIKRDLHVDILIQVNIADEETKSGFTVTELYDSLEEFSNLSNVHCKGLMIIPPFANEPEDNRPYFKALHEIFVDIKSKNIDNISMHALSMGMTGDYEVAVEEGATYVRVGTGIFGARNKA